MDSSVLMVENDISGVKQKLCDMIECIVRENSHNDFFKIGVSGGSMVKLLTEVLCMISTDWSRWRFFFCDERIVPFDSNESNYGLYKCSLVDKLPITEDQFIVINPKLSAEDAAKDYSEKLKFFFSTDHLPVFDLLLLGLGPDGHTCSLFPNHKVLEETAAWVSPVIDSPKPPPCRVTLTLPVINNAKYCIFPIVGSSKAEIIKRIYKDKEDLPATRIQPTGGKVYWILDKEAASKL